MWAEWKILFVVIWNNLPNLMLNKYSRMLNSVYHYLYLSQCLRETWKLIPSTFLGWQGRQVLDNGADSTSLWSHRCPAAGDSQGGCLHQCHARGRKETLWTKNQVLCEQRCPWSSVQGPMTHGDWSRPQLMSPPSGEHYQEKATPQSGAQISKILWNH